MHINKFNLVVFKRQHSYVFHIFTGCLFVRHFPVLQIQRPRAPLIFNLFFWGGGGENCKNFSLAGYSALSERLLGFSLLLLLEVLHCGY